jgi:hypothetical protein
VTYALSNIYIFDNVFYQSSGDSVDQVGIIFRAAYGHNGSLDNLYIVNNTFDNLLAGGIRIFADSGYTVTITNTIIENNIFNNNAYNLLIVNDSGGTVNYADTDLLLRNNVFYKSAGFSVTYGGGGGTTYTGASALDARSASTTGNSGSRPVFFNLAGHNYQLSSSDTAARGQGLNLTSLGITALDYDILGGPRPATGTWDIGAYAYRVLQGPKNLRPE